MNGQSWSQCYLFANNFVLRRHFYLKELSIRKLFSWTLTISPFRFLFFRIKIKMCPNNVFSDPNNIKSLAFSGSKERPWSAGDSCVFYDTIIFWRQTTSSTIFFFPRTKQFSFEPALMCPFLGVYRYLYNGSAGNGKKRCALHVQSVLPAAIQLFVFPVFVTEMGTLRKLLKIK